MDLLGIKGKRGPWSCEGLMPSVGECQHEEAGVGRWLGEHPHRRREDGGYDRVFKERDLGKQIFEIERNLTNQ